MFKSQEAQDEHVGSLAFIAACAKAGVSPAPNLNYSGCSKSELHENRKAARTAINKIRQSIGLSEPSDEDITALTWAGLKVGHMTDVLDNFDPAVAAKDASSMNVLRNSADFQRHYARNSAEDPDLNIVDFVRGVANMTTTQSVRNALSVGTDTAGGFSVPARLMPGILGALVPVSSLLQAGAGIMPLEDGAKTYTIAAVNTIPSAAWRAEAGTLATSDPTFRAVTATPRSLAFTFKISRELLADGQGLTESLYQAIAQSFARELDRAGLRGTGTAPEPRGILNTALIQSVTNGVNGASLATTKYANIFSGVQAILQADAPMPTAVIMSPRSLVVLGGLADSTAQPLRVPGMLEPMKLIATSQIPNTLTVGTSSDCSEIYLGDFTQMFFAMREAVSIQLLSELYAATGEIGFACHVRADVVVRYPSAFSLVTGVRP